MRLAVSGNGYTAATNAFGDANSLAAATAHALMGVLEHSGAMAGHTAASFALTYDDAAREGVSALVDVVDAVANLGRMSEATRRNHTYAEHHAVLDHRANDDITPTGPSYSQMAARMPPSAAGTHGSDLPGWAAWILDRVEGFVWPDSDVDRLRQTARAWRAASDELVAVKTRCHEAAFSLSLEIAPDISLAVDATRRFATEVDSLSQTFHGIARSCDDLAAQVEHHRQQVLDIVRDTLRDAVIIEGIGLVLGAVTGGITAAAATSVNGARIAVIAPRLIRIIEALRIATGASETGARVATEAVVEARTGLRAFIQARMIATSDRGCAAPFSWFEALHGAPLMVESGRRVLEAEERAGGHLLAKHVARTREQLMERFAGRPSLKYASSFDDQASAERFVDRALSLRQNEIAAWLAQPEDSLAFEADLGERVGLTMDRHGRRYDASSVQVVLRKHPYLPGGYRIHTAFPTLTKGTS